ncbi:MAG: ArnT family glycosyltransferase [Vicinamibacterales bacterium]
MTPRRFAAALGGIALLALTLRIVYPAADPPWRATVGIVWHDEGAWVHNARNKALFGTWRLDEWNPVYIAPVFTALEYASFALFGVGVQQARLVSELAGVLSVILLALGVRRIAGNAAAIIAAALVAANYVYVMYDRAAIMEALMVAFIVASWYCSTEAERHPAWGAAAGVMATLAFFTKAAAAFYVAALAFAAVVRFVPAWSPDLDAERRRSRIRAVWTLAGLAAAFGLIAAFFVLPHWADYRFYNWQVSVTRKPSYGFASIAQRITWFPILHDTFSRMWPVLVLGVFGAWSIVVRWRAAHDPERLLLLWVAVGSAELLIHDVGNERRFVFLIPALIALAALVLARGALLPPGARAVGRRALLMVSPLVLYTAYVVAGPVVRLAFLDQVHNHVLHSAVRLAAAGAFALGVATIAAWPALAARLTAVGTRPRAAVALVILLLVWDLGQFGDWALNRTYKNYEASIALGRALPPGTLVQGKLANGLDLENRIRPIFIGHDFGNFADRKQRSDVRYILTYIDPSIGYEGSQIEDVLAAYPDWRIVMTFDVAETPSGHDRAALIDKRAGH